MEYLAETFLTEPPPEYDSDTAADELIITTPNHSTRIGMRTCTDIFKNALENRTSSKAGFYRQHCYVDNRILSTAGLYRQQEPCWRSWSG